MSTHRRRRRRRGTGAERRAASPASVPVRDWDQIRALLAELPQMRRDDDHVPEPTAKFGKRRSDRRTINVEAPVSVARRFRFGRLAMSMVPALPTAPKVVRNGLRSVSWRHAMLVAACLVATFGLGFLTGRM